MDGINKVLYNKQELATMLTKEEVMNNLHIKDYRSFMKLIEKEHLPHIKIGKQYLIPEDEYKKWIKRMICD